MADRLAKRGLPHHPACPICDRAEETIQHILVSCVYTSFFHKLSMAALTPLIDAPRFVGWWRNTIRNTPKEIRKGLNSLIILVAWKVWKFRNVCVFRDFLLIFRTFYKRSLMNIALGAWQVLLTSRTYGPKVDCHRTL